MPAIQCPTCQKEYRWKPELAGRRVKCRCGSVIAVPANEPSADPDELYDLADSSPDQAEHAIGDLQSIAAPAAVEESNEFRCPYCGQNLEAGAAMCVFCGTSFAERAAAARKPKSAMESAPPVTNKSVKMRGPNDEDRAGRIKLFILLAIALVIVGGAVYGIKKFAGHTNVVDANLKPGDAEIQAKIASENGTEAHDWLNALDGRMMGGWNKKQALYHVDEWYSMGAKKVYSFGGAYSMSAVIELPDDPAKRKALFEWQKKWRLEMLLKPEIDEGQKYIEIPMRI